MVSVTVELIELRCRCGAVICKVQLGAGYHNTCHKCGRITVGVAGQRPVIAPVLRQPKT